MFPNLFGTDARPLERTTASDDGDATEAGALKRTLGFVYRHSTLLACLSVCWVLSLVPVVTAGPATVAFYTVVLSIREHGVVDWRTVRDRTRETAIHAALLGTLPVAFLAIGALDLLSSSRLAVPAIVVGTLALYAGVYGFVVLIPTFVALAEGATPVDALRRGYVWTARQPTLAVRVAIVSVALLVATLALTFAFVVLFAALACTYHVSLLEDTGFLTGDP